MAKKNITSRLAQDKFMDSRDTAPETAAQGSPKTGSTKPYQTTVEDGVSAESDKGYTSSRRNKVPETGSVPENRAQPQSSSHVSVTASSRSSRSRSSSSESDIDPVLKDSRNPLRVKQPAARVHFRDRPSPRIGHPSGSSSDPPQRQSGTRLLVKDDERQGSDMSSPMNSSRERLFDSKWRPTERLHDVYREIANHMIELFTPKRSSVLTTRKLFRFYERFACEHEILPFMDIFNDQRETTIESLLDLMRCEYHLIPSRPGQPPSCPALTATGFVTWMDQCVQAAPDQKAERLARVVAELDMESKGFGTQGFSERVPKQVPRHLFPPKPDETIRDMMAMACEAAQLKTRRKSGQAAPAVVQSGIPQDRRDTSPSPPYKRERGRGPASLDEDPVPDTAGFPPDLPRLPVLASAERNSAAFDSSRRHVPKNVLVTTVTEEEPPYRYQPRAPRSGSQPTEQYVNQPRRHRSPSPHDVIRRRRRDSSPPPRRQPSAPPPPSRSHRNSISGGVRPSSDLFRGVSTLQPWQQAEHQRRRGRYHSPKGRRYSRGGRESEYGYYYPASRGGGGGSRRSSIVEVVPRSPVDNKGSGSARRRERDGSGSTYVE